MEPIHYLRALRRRWWVIVLAVLVAGGAAWITTTVAPSTPAASATDVDYSATTVLWDPGTPIFGQVTAPTNMTTLAQLVRLPRVASIAAQNLKYEGDPLELRSRIQASADETAGLLNVTATAKDPADAETTSTAFSHALITYLGELTTAQIEQRERVLRQQIKALQQQSADPTVIASLQAALTQVQIGGAVPVSLAVIQPATSERISSQSSGTFQAPKSRQVRVLLAALFGLLAGIVLVLVLERFDTRIRSTGSAEAAFGLPVLAEVPAIRRRRRGRPVSATHPYSRAAGAFRVLCLATRRWSSSFGEGRHAPEGSGDAKVVLVTSAEARDGKTTVAANLAAAYAQDGSRVLVISADLRRPAIHRTFGVPDRPGLVDLLDDPDPDPSLDPTPYLEPCSVVRVAVLPSGITSEDPGELLGSVRMRRFMERLRRVTDVVVVDCAPLVVASDVIPLLPQVDGVVLVARAGKTRRALAANAAELLQRMGAHQVGVVLNDARELSIPLAKRRMYRPTRKMRKAARRSAQPQGPSVPEPGASGSDAETSVVVRSELRDAGVAGSSREPVAVPEAGASSTAMSPPAGAALSQQLMDLVSQLQARDAVAADPGSPQPGGQPTRGSGPVGSDPQRDMWSGRG